MVIDAVLRRLKSYLIFKKIVRLFNEMATVLTWHFYLT